MKGLDEVASRSREMIVAAHIKTHQDLSVFVLIEQIWREFLSRKYLRDFSISLNKLYIILRVSSKSQTDSAYSLSPMERPFHDTSETFNCALSSPANVGGAIESAVHGIPKAIEACTPYTKTPSESWEPMHGVNNQ